MTSNDSRYRIWGCLTPSPTEPDLGCYFEERAADLVTSLADSLIQTHSSAGALTTPENFESFCTDHGIDHEQLRGGLYHVALAEPLGRPEEREKLAEHDGERRRRLVAFLVQDFRLLEQWIRVRKGEDYLTLLLGTYRPVPWFGEESCVPVDRYLTLLRDPGGLTPGDIPLRGVLVEDGRNLRIARESTIRDGAALTSLLEQFPGYFLWVVLFTA